MITKTKVSGGYGPRRKSFAPVDYSDTEEFISPRQMETLKELIYRHIQDEDDREGWLSQIGAFTHDEADQLILNFSTSWYR